MTDFKLVTLTSELLPGALDVLRDTFFPDEKVCNCVNLLVDSPVVSNGSKYKCTEGSLQLEALVVDTTKDGVSVAAVDNDTNEVIGVAFNKLQTKPAPGEIGYFEKFAKEHITDPTALAIVDFMIDVDSKFDIMEHFQTSCALEIMFLGVKNSARGRGIGQALVEKSIQIGLESPRKPGVACSIFSSRFSQKIGKRVGMQCLYECFYKDYEYKGRSYLEVTGDDHPSSQLCAIKLQYWL